MLEFTVEGQPGKSASTCLLGAIAGDMIGVPYEHHSSQNIVFELFTTRSHFSDDSVLTLAVAESILGDGDYGAAIRRWGQRYPHAGYGGFFRDWLRSDDPQPYNSFGNGSAMRVSAVGWAFDSIEDVLIEAEKSAACTHNHPEGIKGAQAVALAIFLARTGASKEQIQREIETRFAYDLAHTLKEIRPDYEWDVTCQGSVPESMIAFLESTDFESAIRNAISLGGDADTMAAIAGSIAEAFYGGVPDEIAAEVRERLPADLWRMVADFGQKYAIHFGSGV